MKQPSVASSCIIYFRCIEHSCAVFRSGAAAASTATVTPPSWAKPLENFPRVCRSRRRRLVQRAFKVAFFIEKLQMKRMPQKQFHLSPNEAFTDPVSKLWSNKLQPANINEICSPTAKQAHPERLLFIARSRQTLHSPLGQLTNGLFDTGGSILKSWSALEQHTKTTATVSDESVPKAPQTSGQRLLLLSKRKMFLWTFKLSVMRIL